MDALKSMATTMSDIWQDGAEFLTGMLEPAPPSQPFPAGAYGGVFDSSQKRQEENLAQLFRGCAIAYGILTSCLVIALIVARRRNPGVPLDNVLPIPPIIIFVIITAVMGAVYAAIAGVILLITAIHDAMMGVMHVMVIGAFFPFSLFFL